MGHIERRLAELNITLPHASNPAANYTNCVEANGFLFVSGKVPLPGAVGAQPPKGKLGREYTTQQGYQLARSAGTDILAVVQLALGSLDRVARVVNSKASSTPLKSSTNIPKSSTAAPISWSKCSATRASTPAPSSALCLCVGISRS